MNAHGFTAQLDLALPFALLGKPILLRTNNARILQTATAGYAHWLSPAAPPAPAESSARVDVIAMPPAVQPSHVAPPFKFVERAHGSTFVAACDDIVLSVHRSNSNAHGLGFVPIWFTQPAHQRFLQSLVLDRLCLQVATSQDREPLHAGAVVRRGHAVLLAGPSQAGKSTLCYACVQAGFQLLAEDVVFIQRQPAPRVWGHATHIHLLPNAPDFFDELRTVPPTLQPSGKTKIAVPVQQPALFADRCTLCWLERAAEPAAAVCAQPISSDEALAALFAHIDDGFALYPQARAAAQALLTHNAAYRLRIGQNLSAVVDVLKAMCDRGA